MVPFQRGIRCPEKKASTIPQEPLLPAWNFSPQAYIRSMKTAFVSAASLALSLALFTACSQKSETPSAPREKPAAGESIVSAPTDYLSAAAKAKQNAEKTIDVTALNSALEQFNVGEGRYPKDLNELVSKKYISTIPTPPFGSKLQYDANSGTVKIVKQ